MAWNLEIKTKTSGDHVIWLASKEEAEAALADVEKHIGSIMNEPVKIADQLVVIDSTITSGRIWET